MTHVPESSITIFGYQMVTHSNAQAVYVVSPDYRGPTRSMVVGGYDQQAHPELPSDRIWSVVHAAASNR